MWSIPSDGNAYRMKITHEMAKEALDSSPGNRKTKEATVRKYANDMLDGKWRPGNDVIMFDKNGRMRNGHHRMTAVILSGIPVEMLVRGGVENDEVISIDQGYMRTTFDSLTSFGETHEFVGLTKKQTSVMRMVLNPKLASSFSNDVIGQAIKDFKKEFDFVWNECFSGKAKDVQNILLSVFIRAACDTNKWEKMRYAGQYYWDRGDAVEKQFVKRMPGSCWLKTLYRHLDETKLGAGQARLDAMAISGNCLNNFILGIEQEGGINISKSLKRMKIDELFPIRELPYLNKLKMNKVSNIDWYIALKEAAKTYDHEETLTPQKIAEDIIRHGAKVKGKNPVKSIALWFSKTIKRNNSDKFVVNGTGCFNSVSEKAGQKRINHYRFLREFSNV